MKLELLIHGLSRRSAGDCFFKNWYWVVVAATATAATATAATTTSAASVTECTIGNAISIEVIELDTLAHLIVREVFARMAMRLYVNRYGFLLGPNNERIVSGLKIFRQELHLCVDRDLLSSVHFDCLVVMITTRSVRERFPRVVVRAFNPRIRATHEVTTLPVASMLPVIHVGAHVDGLCNIRFYHKLVGVCHVAFDIEQGKVGQVLTLDVRIHLCL